MNLFVLLILTILPSFHEQSNKSKALDALFMQNQTEANTRQLVSGLIRSQLKRKPGAPASLEQDIHAALDYKGYVQKVKTLFDKTFTEAQIVELTELHKAGNMKLYKEKTKILDKPVYDIGRAFGRESMKVILEKLGPY